MSANKQANKKGSNKSAEKDVNIDQAVGDQVEQRLEEKVEPADVVAPVAESNEGGELPPTESIEVELSAEEVEHENKVVALEGEIVKLTERLAELKKELRQLNKKPSADGPSKMDKCVELFKANAGLARKDLIKLFIDQGGLTLAGARTYAQLILSKNKAGKL